MVLPILLGCDSFTTNPCRQGTPRVRARPWWWLSRFIFSIGRERGSLSSSWSGEGRIPILRCSWASSWTGVVWGSLGFIMVGLSCIPGVPPPSSILLRHLRLWHIPSSLSSLLSAPPPPEPLFHSCVVAFLLEPVPRTGPVTTLPRVPASRVPQTKGRGQMRPGGR